MPVEAGHGALRLIGVGGPRHDEGEGLCRGHHDVHNERERCLALPAWAASTSTLLAPELIVLGM